jgi:hypothetical protein
MAAQLFISASDSAILATAIGVTAREVLYKKNKEPHSLIVFTIGWFADKVSAGVLSTELNLYISQLSHPA